MKIRFERNPIKWLIVIGLAVLAGILIGIGYNIENTMMIMTLIVSCGLLALAVLMKVELKSGWALVLELLITGFAGIFFLQIMITDGYLSFRTFIFNMLLSMALILIILAITGSVKLSSGIWITICLLFGIVDYMVCKFRGSAIVIADFLSIDTALSVSDNYKFSLPPGLLITILLYIAAMLILIRATFPKLKWMKKLRGRVLSLAMAGIMAALPIASLDRYQPNTWKRLGVRDNGVLFEFAMEINQLNLKKPENYSEETVLKIAEEYAVEQSETEKKPHIIAIMVEAWSDLSVLGDFETNEEVMPFLNDFMASTIHGQAVSSVYGGNTATSEWEFLTGNTMAFLPSGAMVYRQYITDDIRTIVDVLSDNGYSSVAMHPYYKSGWNRERVYELIDFDKTIFLEDEEWGDRVRYYVSDDAFMDKLIDEFEARDKDKPIFIFGITMQNHGGYTYEDYEPSIEIVNPETSNKEMDQYLSLIRLTDSAFEKLIAYFETCDEEVIILAFGDHQPSLPEEMDSVLKHPSQLQKHIVPYFIWKNYESDARENQITSINYLSEMLLEEAGIELPPYYAFLKAAQETVPALTGDGIVENGGYKSISEATAEQKEILDKYYTLQYAQMFDYSISDSVFTGEEIEE